MAKSPKPSIRWKSSGNFHKLMDDRYALPVATITVRLGTYAITNTCFSDHSKDQDYSDPKNYPLDRAKKLVEQDHLKLNPIVSIPDCPCPSKAKAF